MAHRQDAARQTSETRPARGEGIRGGGVGVGEKNMRRLSYHTKEEEEHQPGRRPTTMRENEERGPVVGR